jgi:hypothetical protein
MMKHNAGQIVSSFIIHNSSFRMNPLFQVIHEDDNLLVVHKPADLVCHPTKGDEYSSLISRARIYLKTDSEPRLVNRLDRETSGLVVIAKNLATAGELGKIWESRAVQKEYLAIVHGHVAAEQGMIDAPLGKDETSIVAIKDCVRADGTPAQTEFFVEKRFIKSFSRDDSELKTKNSKLKTFPLTWSQASDSHPSRAPRPSHRRRQDLRRRFRFVSRLGRRSFDGGTAGETDLADARVARGTAAISLAGTRLGFCHTAGTTVHGFSEGVIGGADFFAGGLGGVGTFGGLLSRCSFNSA